MIRDRKFYYAIDTFLYSDPDHKSPWRAFPLGTYAEMDTLHVFVEEHSPRNDVKSGSSRGISQDSIALQEGRSYSGHIVLAGSGSVVVRVSLIWGPGPGKMQTVEIPSITGFFEPTPIHFTSQANTGLGILEITGEGDGCIYIGTI